jgi:hypothetical protein
MFIADAPVPRPATRCASVTPSHRLQHLRATESYAWLVTRDGTVLGP